MVVEKRKSFNNAGSVNTPPKKGNFGNQKSPIQKSPGGGNQRPPFQKSPGGGKFGVGGGGGAGAVKPGDWSCPKAACGVNNFASRQECYKCHVKRPGAPGGGAGNASPKVPPPPAQGAKKLNVQVVPPKAEVNSTLAPQKNATNAKKNQQSKKKQEKNGLSKVSDASKAIKRPKKSRSKKFNQKLDLKPRPLEACQRALKMEKELGHTGRVYSVKIADPPLSQEIIKGWSSGIETAVFAKPVEPRQFLVVFKHNANVKKEVENLKKVVFAGGKVQVEEKADSDASFKAHPEAIDPYSLYITNLNESVTKENLKELFPKATLITNAKKHSPKLGYENPSKFAFVNFETTDDALSSFQENYSAVLNGNSIVMRFRRVSPAELAKVTAATAASKAKTSEPAAKKQPESKAKQAPKSVAVAPKKELIKAEPDSDEDEDEEEDEEEIDDEDEDDEDDDDEDMEVEGGEEEEEDDDDEEEDDDDDDDDEDE